MLTPPLNPPSGCAFHPRCQKAMAECSTRRPVVHPLQSGRVVTCHLFDQEP